MFSRRNVNWALGGAVLLLLVAVAMSGVWTVTAQAPVERVREAAPDATRVATQPHYTPAKTPPGLSAADWTAITQHQLPDMEQEAYLKADYVNAGDYFGHAVAISGDTVVVGAGKCDLIDELGTVYVFVREGMTWSQQARLSDPVTGSGCFGAAVANTMAYSYTGYSLPSPDWSSTSLVSVAV